MTSHDDRPPLILPARRRGMFAALRGSFLTGLVVIAPIGLTVWLFWTLAGWIDSWVIPLIPYNWRPEQLIGMNPRGLGAVIFLIATVTIGWLAKGLIGRSLIRWGETIVDRMPVIRSVYGGLKQIAETVLSQSDSKFDRACMIEYPRKGLYALAFISGRAKGEVAEHGAHENMAAVFLPTTPNPTSGFLLFVPESDVTVLDMSVEDAAKLIISAGLVYPPGRDKPVALDGQPNSADRSTVSR